MPSSLQQGSFSQGIKDCIPTLFGYISIGFAFGVVGISSNLNILEIFLISVLVYAGSAQFIFCGLYLTGTPTTIIIFTTFIVNLRHLLMSLYLAPSFTQYSFLRNIGFGSLLTDETFGVATTKRLQTPKLSGRWMDGLNLTAYISWIIACTCGGILGKFIPNAEAWGLDYALTAMFIALLVLQLQHTSKKQIMRILFLIAVIGLCMFTLCHFVETYIAVLISTVFVATIGVVTEKHDDD